MAEYQGLFKPGQQHQTGSDHHTWNSLSYTCAMCVDTGIRQTNTMHAHVHKTGIKETISLLPTTHICIASGS
jgi:hypothetical protein